ncbi:MAG TPA: class I SAM-dependent methyltransferase [Kofleriaceae bacterium]|nr:class I SAM-dependent methyltransferase [Kofleriaceae bacterium]
MEFADHFSRVAARYATYRPTYPPALADELAARTAPVTAWDVGCGNGQLSVALASRFARVIATDPSQSQIDAAPSHPHVTYQCVTAEDSGLSDASVDLVVAAQAAHWFDWPRFVTEAGRIARPGALIALVSYGIVLVEGDAGDIVARYYHEVVGPYWPKGREHVENGYRDLAMPWPAVEAPVLAMEATWTRDELVGYVSTWSATVKLVETCGLAPFEELGRALVAMWPDGERRPIRWPLALRLARR